jgi:DNA-binding transcriptional ArsR family regulator
VDMSQPLDYDGSMDRRPATAEEAQALANPLRLRILRLCLDEALTNKEIARRLGRDAGSTLHHVRMLVRTGFLAPEAERRGARGAVERPYRATGKSWTLDVGEMPAGTLAILDAFREEMAAVSASDVFTLSRLGVRLTPAVREEFEKRLAILVEEMHAADDPAGEPYGLLVGLHRRRDEPVEP